MSIESFKHSIANALVNAFVKRVPVDTGFLKNSIRYEIHGDEIHFFMPYYWKFVEFGTSPHEITPLIKKSLKFNIGGNVVFAKKVQHPGTHPQPFVRPALHQELKAIVEKSARIHLGELA